MLLRAFSAFHKFNRCIITSITIISKYSSHTNKPEWKMDKSLTQNETSNANILHRFLFLVSFFLFSFVLILNTCALNRCFHWMRMANETDALFFIHFPSFIHEKRFVIYCKIQSIGASMKFLSPTSGNDRREAKKILLIIPSDWRIWQQKQKKLMMLLLGPFCSLFFLFFCFFFFLLSFTQWFEVMNEHYLYSPITGYELFHLAGEWAKEANHSKGHTADIKSFLYIS